AGVIVGVPALAGINRLKPGLQLTTRVRMPAMKLRHPVLIKAAGFAAAWAVRIWIGTMGFRYRPLGPFIVPTERHKLRERFIYAFWHENMLLPAYHFNRPDAWVLISQHRDGELIAAACQSLRLRGVRGS